MDPRSPINSCAELRSTHRRQLQHDPERCRPGWTHRQQSLSGEVSETTLGPGEEVPTLVRGADAQGPPAHPDRYQALVAVAAGCGLRQGECFGVRVHDIDFLRGEFHVRQQIRLVNGAPAAALPKYGRTRTVPLPEWVANSLAAHIAELPPLVGEPASEPSLAGLVFYGREHKPMNRNYFNSYIWRPALQSAGVPRGRENGMHALRHSCASTWLEHGVSIKAVSEYLGHADPGFTLRVYTHVMPSSGEKARNAMDAAFGAGCEPAEGASIPGAPPAHESTTKGGN